DQLHGKLFGYRIDAHDGSLSPLTNFPIAIGGHPQTLAADPLGRFIYVGGDRTIGVFALDASSGALTGGDHSPFDAGDNVAFVAAGPSGGFVYASQPAGAIAAFAVDARSGALSAVDGSPFHLPTPGRPGGIVFHPNGAYLYYGAGKVYGFSVNDTT